MISILIPTRNRPNNIKRILSSIIETSDNLSDIEICMYIDDDDTVSIDALSEMSPKISINAFQGPRIILNAICNVLYKQAVGPIYMCCGDDVVFRTKGWDTIIKKLYDESDDKIILAYGADGFQNEKIATHAFFHKNWAEIIGYLLPPYFAVAFSDTWVTDVAERIHRRKYLPNLIFEHMHPAANKAAWDITYTSKQEVGGNESALYYSQQMTDKRILDAKKLKEFIDINASTYKV